MCGICGKVDLTGAPVREDLVRSMCAMLVHRGPDAEGVRTGPGFGLGQRRLSIVDLTPAGVAPLPNEDGTLWVTFNGEIYNFPELRAQLESRGHTFRTGTDTEVLVHLYEEFGVDCVRHLRGMFAFALWDGPNRRLFAARDRLGKKPFYYTRTGTSFVFGSELRALLADPSVRREPNMQAIDAYLTFQYVPSPLTAFRGISKLPAAHYLVCDERGEVTVTRYWQAPAPSPAKRSGAELRDELLWRLREAVRLRLMGDVPIGAFLSGGIDSATVVALMARESGRRVQTFSIGFEEEEFNELEYARLTAERYETEHHEFMIRPDAAEVLPRLVQHYGEPFGDSSALPVFYLSQLTRTSVTVALSGDGGDESFGGYDNYAIVQAWGRYDAFPQTVRRAVSRGAASVAERLPYSATGTKLSRGAQMIASALPDRFHLQTTIFKPQEKRAAYTRTFRHLVGDASPQALTQLSWEPSVEPLDWMMRHDLQFYLPDCLMVKTDVASMAHGLEVRCPLLDHELVEFAATIPAHLKHGDNGQGKQILRDTMRDLVPGAVLAKKKTGFGVPLSRWFREDLLGLLRGTLLDERARRRDLFERAFVARMIEEHRDGRRDWSARLWTLLFLELWFREFLD